jgi:hypothetical protein
VLDAETGEPIEGAEITYSYGEERTARSDPEGRYRFEGLSAEWGVRLRARAPGYADGEGELPRASAVPELDLRLVRGRSVRGSVFDARGAPVAGAYVAACASEHRGDPTMQHIDWRSTRTDESGVYEIGDLRTDVRHTLLVRAEGHGTVVLAFPDPEPARLELPAIVLPAPATIRGACIDERGTPIADQLVTLAGSNRDRWRLAAPPAESTWSIDGYIAERSARTDDRGRFVFADVAPGDYRVRASLLGVHDGIDRILPVREGERIDGLELVLDFGRTISGRILTADDGAVPKVYVSVDPEDGGSAADVEADPEGRFAVAGLPAGRYTLTAYPYPTPEDRALGRFFSFQRVTGVLAGSEDVEIVLDLEARVTGIVVDATGVPVANGYVAAFAPDGAEIAGASTDGAGGFSIALPANLIVTLVATPPQRLGPDGRVLPHPPGAGARREGVRAGGEPLRLVLGG